MLGEFGLQLQCNYKYQDETMERDPAAWTVQGRRSQCKVVFEVILPDMTPCLTAAVEFKNIADGKQNIPFPQQMTTELRCRKAEKRAKETTALTGCPSRFCGYAGQDNGNELIKDTDLIFE